MSTVDEWLDDSSLVKFLGRQLADGSLTLVLGAGVSSHFGLPTWPKLIQRLFRSKGAPVPRKPPSGQAEDFRNKYYKSDTAGFLLSVKSALYHGARVDFDSMRSHNTLAAIASCVMASRRAGSSHVVTFNFDDLLEIYLEYHGYTTLSVGERLYWSKAVDVTVLHPHGILPYNGARPTSTDIVFDQFSFTKAIGTRGSAWRQLLLSIMRTRTCIFIGLSGDDPNLDSLLVRCMSQHASRLDGAPFWGLAFSVSEESKLFWDKRKVFLKKVENYDVALPQFLFSICQSAASHLKL